MSTLDEIRREIAEDDDYDAHDAAHPDPEEHWGECARCEGFILGDIEMGLRCRHGRHIPFVADKRGSVITDVECDLGCQVDYGPAFYTDWKQILEQEVLRLGGQS